VAGPFSAGGVQFRFFDSVGTPAASPSGVARIDIVLRSASALGPRIPGLSGTVSDSALFTIVPRE